MEFNDRLVRKISVLVSVIGIASLLFLVLIEEPLKISVSEIDDSFLDKRVVSEGIAKERYFAKNTLFFSLFDEGSIKVVYFSPSIKTIGTIRENVKLRVKGVVKSYKGQLEIVAEEIELID